MSETIQKTVDPSVKYKRVIIKISGEALAKENGTGIDNEKLEFVCRQIVAVKDLGVDVGIVIGGGNFWRGLQAADKMNRATADYMGMLATTINCLALQDVFEHMEVDTRVMTAVEMKQFAEPYIRNRAVRHLEKGRVVVFGCGTGNPFFSTDTAAALRAAEIEADIILKATMVDGVYDSDPKKNPDAKKFKTLTFQEVLNQNLGVMDSTAAAICKDNNIPIIVFSLDNPQNIVSAVCGEDIGTLVE